MCEAQIEEIVRLLGSKRFRFSCEEQLQEAVEGLLRDSSVSYIREETLTPKSRIDFMVGSLGIELKVKGSTQSVLRQLARYADVERVESLLLVTTQSKHRSMPTLIRNVPLRVHYINPLL